MPFVSSTHSFDAEVSPLVVEVEGETVELTGSAEAQFAEWRKIAAPHLRQRNRAHWDRARHHPDSE